MLKHLTKQGKYLCYTEYEKDNALTNEVLVTLLWLLNLTHFKNYN